MNRETITIENGIVSVPASAGIWMTQHQLAELFQCFVGKINANVRAILKTGVLDKSGKHWFHPTLRFLVLPEHLRLFCRIYHYKNGNFVEQYNLEVITALSFRIKSRNAKIFRCFIMKKIITDTSRQESLIHILWKRNGMMN